MTTTMDIRSAREDDAEALAQAEYETAAAQEGLLASLPGEIPVSAFREKVRALAERGLFVVLEADGRAVGTCCSSRWGWR